MSKRQRQRFFIVPLLYSEICSCLDRPKGIAITAQNKLHLHTNRLYIPQFRTFKNFAPTTKMDPNCCHNFLKKRKLSNINLFGSYKCLLLKKAIFLKELKKVKFHFQTVQQCSKNKKQKNVQNENSVKSCNCYKLREYCSAVVVLLTSLLSWSVAIVLWLVKEFSSCLYPTGKLKFFYNWQILTQQCAIPLENEKDSKWSVN